MTTTEAATMELPDLLNVKRVAALVTGRRDDADSVLFAHKGTIYRLHIPNLSDEEYAGHEDWILERETGEGVERVRLIWPADEDRAGLLAHVWGERVNIVTLNARARERSL